MPHIPPLVSVVIPVYNRSNQVHVAIASALAQQQTKASNKNKTFDLEIIVVDDGSTHPMSDYPDPRVKFIRHEVNHGAGAARNTGVRHASGEYIAFLDSDDTWTAGKIAAQVDMLKSADRGVFGVFCPFKKSLNSERHYSPQKTRENWFDTFLGGCRVAPGSTLMFRQDLWNDVGPQNETLSRYEDWDWLLHAAQAYKFNCISSEYAVLGASKQPSYKVVDQSLRALEALWLSKIDKHQSRRFAAALAIERSAHARANRLLVSFIKNLTLALRKGPRTVFENLRWRFMG